MENKPLNYIKRILGPAAIAVMLTFGLGACDQQHGAFENTEEDRDDTTASGQVEIITDTTATASYGSAGDVPATEGPDLDTVPGVDVGVHPETIYEEAKSKQ